MRAPYRRHGGFTIIEMMTVVAIVGILASIAIPAFNSVIDRQRAKNAASDIYITLMRARSEALKLNQNIVLSSKSGTTDWSSGWTIADPINAGLYLENHEALRNVTVSGPSGVTYKSSGRVAGGGTFTISGNDASSTRYVCLDLSGRPAIKTTGSC